jgi:hypothetical protein
MPIRGTEMNWKPCCRGTFSLSEKSKSQPFEVYQPFEGICLTDTFQLYEKEDLISELLVDNSKRRKRQKKLDIRVITDLVKAIACRNATY